MIIKKKYATIKKTESLPSEIEQTEEIVDDSLTQDEEVVETTEAESVPAEQEKETDIPAEDDDFDLTIENIKFEPRQERREGSRRRGYRRSHDRNIITRAQKEAINIKEAAKKEGYEEGIEKAVKDLDELKNNFSEFFNYKEKVFDKVSLCIMDVSVEIAKKILNKEIETDKSYILPVIKGVVEEINKTENKIILKVMPKDVEIVRDNIKDIFSDNFFEAKISVVPDKEIQDGGVKVETSNGIIDATIETQLAIIQKALKKQEEG